MKLIKIIAFLILSINLSAQENRPVLDIMLTNYEYPYKVNFLNLKSQNQDLTMCFRILHKW